VSDSTLTAGSLARAGFSSPDAALPVLRRLPSSLRDGLVTRFSRAAEPDLALWSLTRLVESEGPRRPVESRVAEISKQGEDRLAVRSGRAPDRVADAHDLSGMRHPSGERRLVLIHASGW